MIIIDDWHQQNLHEQDEIDEIEWNEIGYEAKYDKFVILDAFLQSIHVLRLFLALKLMNRI